MNGDAPSTVEHPQRTTTMTRKIGRSVRRPSDNDGTLPEPVSSPGFVDLYPHLAEFLVKSRGSGQTPSTGTVTLFLEQGRFKLCLNDRPRSRSTFVSGRTLYEALGAADAGIGSNRLKWRTRGYVQAPDRQKTLSRA